jgi:hypothetical protein
MSTLAGMNACVCASACRTRPPHRAAAPTRARARHHGREIDAHRAAARRQAPRQLDGRLTAAASDVEHAFARQQRSVIHGAAPERSNLIVDQLLQRNPFGPGSVVPVLDLFGVRSGYIE